MARRNRLTALVLAFLLPVCSWSATSDGLPDNGLAAATGQFNAIQRCEMYQSKRSRTNPGGLETTPGAAYPVREVVTAQGEPEWLRLDSGEPVQVPLRWVEARCGKVSDLAGGYS